MSTIRVRGVPQAVSAIERIKRSTQAASLPAVEAGGKVIMEAARQNAPQKTGRLRNSIILDERETTLTGARIEVTSTVPYARHQEKGTRFHPAQPFIERAATAMVAPVEVVVRRVYRAAIGR